MTFVGNVGETPTSNAKARKLLKQKRATVKTVKPFTIQLNYKTTEYKQKITLGIDSGYMNIGFSAVTKDKELISGEVKLLANMSERLRDRTTYRRARRSRLRHRKPRWNNRTIPKGWLAPSIQHKLDSHIRFIAKLHNLLPVSETVIEVANFDIQKIKKPEISGDEYQDGEQSDFFNLREYIFHRDGYTCQHCGKTHLPLQVHHIGYWQGDRSDRPGNLITLCVHCHLSSNHKEGKFLFRWKPKLKSFRDETFMSTVRWRLVNSLECKHSYGFDTKSKRIAQGLEKTHYNDAFCIAGGISQQRCNPMLYEQIRRNNRSLEKFYDAKYIDLRTGKKVSASELHCGRRTRNKDLNSENLKAYRGDKISKGRRSIRKQRYFYQPGDLVKYEGKIYRVKGCVNYGNYVALKEINKQPNATKVKPYRFRSGFAAF